MTLQTVIHVVIVLQVLTFLALFPLLFANGAWNLGIAQGLLALVTLFVYWPWAA